MTDPTAEKDNRHPADQMADKLVAAIARSVRLRDRAWRRRYVSGMRFSHLVNAAQRTLDRWREGKVSALNACVRAIKAKNREINGDDRRRPS